MYVHKQTEYSLRILRYLHEHSGTTRYHNSQDIAKAINMSSDFIYKVLRPLKDHGLIKAGRGRTGGFALAHPAEDITVYSVLNAVNTEVNIFFSSALVDEDKNKRFEESCPIKNYFTEVDDRLSVLLSEKSIADLT